MAAPTPPRISTSLTDTTSFQAADIQLVSDANYCSPADLKASPHLEAIPNPTLPMPPEEAAAWDGRVDVPQLMRDAINALLSGARSRNASIETFDDLHAHLIAHPDQDEEMCLLLDTSWSAPIEVVRSLV